VDETRPRPSLTAIAAVSIAGVALLTALVIIPRVSRMNDFTADDSDPVNYFAIAFVGSMLVPLVAFRRASQWPRLARVQGVVAVVACAVLFVFKPSDDGMYLLPIALAAFATGVASITATTRIWRAPA
jgi:peptidoglycan/LPS O-acetylase OafA/YrhL